MPNQYLESAIQILDEEHPDNTSFNNSIDANKFPLGFSVWRDNAGGIDITTAAQLVIATGTPVDGIQVDTPILASGVDASRVRFDHNFSRPSWFFYQSPISAGVNRRFLVAKKLSSNLPSDFSVVCRFVMFDTTGAGAPFNGEFGFHICMDNAISPNTPLANNTGHAAISIAPTGGGFVATLVANGSSVNRDLGPNANFHFMPEYMMIRRKNGNIHGYLGTTIGSWSRIGTILLSSGNTGGVFRWWGITHVTRNDGTDITGNYVGVDFLKRYDLAPSLV